MSAKPNTTATTVSREEMAKQIADEIMSGLGKPSGSTFTDRVLQYTSNKIADAGNGVAEIVAGFSAASDNYEIAKNAAAVRQRQRTAAKVAALVELELQARGH